MEAQMAKQRYPRYTADEEIQQEKGDRHRCNNRQRLNHGNMPPGPLASKAPRAFTVR